MTEPTALDLLFNTVVSDRDVKKMVKVQAKILFEQALVFRLPEAVTRKEVSIELTKWIESKGLTGRGTKKLVDKAVARAMKDYCRSLHELNSISEFDKFRDTPVDLYDSWADKAYERARYPWRYRMY